MIPEGGNVKITWYPSSAHSLHVVFFRGPSESVKITYSMLTICFCLIFVWVLFNVFCLSLTYYLCDIQSKQVPSLRNILCGSHMVNSIYGLFGPQYKSQIFETKYLSIF